jgi:hypothetical protein
LSWRSRAREPSRVRASVQPIPACAFPISGSPQKFQAAAKSQLKGVSATHVRAIEATQPYQPGQHWLRVLQELSNADKHMPIHLMRSETIGELEVRDDANPGGPALTRSTDAGALNVHVDFDVTLFEAFDDGTPVLETLEVLLPSVNALVHDFVPAFHEQ